MASTSHHDTDGSLGICLTLVTAREQHVRHTFVENYFNSRLRVYRTVRSDGPRTLEFTYVTKQDTGFHVIFIKKFSRA